MTGIRAPWIAVAGAVAFAAAVAGCGGGAAAAVPAPVPTPTLSSTAQLKLPIMTYELSSTQSAEANYLSQLDTQRCMRGFGFDYLPGLSASSVAENVRITEELDSRRYGVSDASVIATYGYHLPPWTKGTAAPAAFPAPGNPEFAVLTGQPAGSYHSRPIPQGGCTGQASRELAAAGIDTGAQASGGPDSGLVQQMTAQDFTRAQSDPRVRAVDARWARCMRSYGYTYATPFQAAERWNLNAPVSSAEVQTAEHDVACKKQVNLIGVDFAVESDYENADIAHNSQALSQVKSEIARDAAGIRKEWRLLAHDAAS